MKRAVVVGIDDYRGSGNDLQGCVADALSVTDKLKNHGDGDPNFEVVTLTSDVAPVTTEALDEGVRALFRGPAETVVFYFAGHGLLDAETNSGHLLTHDFKRGAPGLSMETLLGMANEAFKSNIHSTVIILDCCHAGFLGEVGALGNRTVSTIGTGVTILTAAGRNQKAAEHEGHGLFTGIMLDGLNGSACDVLGRITPAALYALIDQTLGNFGQRPIYKVNVQTFITLREVAPKVPREVLRRLKDYFPTPGSVFPVDPSFEPDRGAFAEEYRHVEVVAANAAAFREMQAYYRVNLVTPVDQPFPWHAAMHRTGFRLTAQGAHYRMMAEKNKF